MYWRAVKVPAGPKSLPVCPRLIGCLLALAAYSSAEAGGRAHSLACQPPPLLAPRPALKGSGKKLRSALHRATRRSAAAGSLLGETIGRRRAMVRLGFLSWSEP